jgi:hypothetical protein
MDLLSRVDEQEEERKRTRGAGALIDRKRGDLGQELVERRGTHIPTAPRAAGAAERFDGLERFITLEPPNYPAECVGKPAHVFVERKILGARRRFGRNGAAGHRGEASHAGSAGM